MFFLDQFETFDPVSGEVPSHPFTYMPAIASRARAILRCGADEWCRAKLASIAKRINRELDRYFSDIKIYEIERLREQAGLLESIGGDPDWPPNEEYLDIQTWENTSEVDALKSVVENRDSHLFFSKDPLPKSEEYPEGKDYELFAVLALWMLADGLRFLNTTAVGLAIAGEFALKAMDAVCYAEHLREAEWLASYVEKQGNIKLTEALIEQKNDAQKQKSALAKRLNVARHQKTTEAKAMAIEEFMKDRDRFPSAEKAGIYLADWLRDQGRPFEPRTVTSWIRAHATATGFRFR
ncbi:hypothetical protein Tbd_2676 [Thiobacillus denitrificans ATCC 25259]|uniref:Uncharacterized protein n=2 Tax=Thiobacillus denitrificans TaxID=36861 RepID=Q3SFI1_THIDA|nr:hypothetical protein Tbd_2676 [Thiobacillus denitrificans ATCC 25259]